MAISQDGFEDGDYTKNPQWNNVDATSISVQTGTVKNGTYSLSVESGAIQHDRGSNDQINDNDTYQCWFYYGGFVDYSISNSSGDVSGNDAVRIKTDGESGRVNLSTYDSSGSAIASNIIDDSTSVGNGNWYRAEVDFDQTNSQVTARLYDSGGTQLGSVSNQTYSGASNIQYVILEQTDDLADYTAYFDDVSYAAEVAPLQGVSSAGGVGSVGF